MPVKNVSINVAAKAVLPNGKLVARENILQQLGLNPGTSPDAWLAIVACGSNASALNPSDAKILVERGVISDKILDAATLKKIRGG